MGDNAGTLVVGLGNPGPEYEQTRHNFGFLVLDNLNGRAGGFNWQQKFSGTSARVRVGSEPCLLLKPLTFMNRSGRSVARAAEYFHYDIDQILVVHDDLDLPFGTVRVKEGGGTGGHKGLNSCVQLLGGNDFLRVRMGIGRPTHGDVTNFVLTGFSEDERIELMDIIARGCDAVETVVTEGVTFAMNSFNKRGGERDEP